MDQKKLGCNAGHKRSEGVTPEVNLRNPSCVPNGGTKAEDPCFETLVKRYQMFKTGVPPPEIEHICPQFSPAFLLLDLKLDC